MRVLLVSEEGQSHEAPLLQAATAKGVVFHRVALAPLRKAGGSSMARTIRRYLPGATLTRPIAEAVADFKPDLIHVDLRRAVALAVVKAMRGRTDIPIVMDHGAVGGLNALNPFDWQTYFNRRIAKIVLPARATVNHWLGSPLLSRCISAKRCAVVPLFVQPLPEAVDEAGRAALREKYGFGPDVFVIGTVCNIRPIKNLPFIAAIVRELGKDFVFAVVGRDLDAEETARIREAGGERVRLLGRITYAQSMMSCFDLYVTPTRRGGEGFGQAQAEAMSNGVPALAMNFGGCAEIFEHGVSGLALPADPAHWKQAILDLAADPARRRRMGEAARSRISERFSPDAIASQRIDFYRAVIAGAAMTDRQP